MELHTVKTKSEIVLDGISVEVERHDQSVRTITLTDAAGHVVRVTGDYSIRVLVPTPPVKVEKFVVAGEILDTKVEEKFDTESEAKRRIESVDEKLYKNGDHTLTVTTVQVDQDIPF